jgi:type VI secretion system protein ImpH
MKRDPLLDELRSSPWQFEFTQALRILLRNSEHGQMSVPEDRRYDVANEPVRIGTHQSLGFPASPIQELGMYKAHRDAEPYLRMLVNFMGLTGPAAVLPHPYTEFLMTQASDARGPDREAPANFLDIFNHRLAMLSYFAWEKYRYPVARERRADHDFFRQILLSLAGLGTEFLQGRQFTPDDVYAKYAGLLAIQPRSAATLENLLADDLKIPVEVQQFSGAWYRLDEDSATRFGDDPTDSVRLGYGVVISEELWSREFMVRIRLGPLNLQAYRRFLRGGPGLKRIEEICRLFSRGEMVFEVQLVLRKEDVPAARLAEGTEEGESQLGWTTWARSVGNDGKPIPSQRDVEEVVIRLS